MKNLTVSRFMLDTGLALCEAITLNSENVLSAGLFGSCARGEGTLDSDFDIIITPQDSFLAGVWLGEASKLYGVEYAEVMPGALKTYRRNLAVSILNVNIPGIAHQFGVDLTRLDVFVFPDLWSTIHGLQETIKDYLTIPGAYAFDPNFFENAARDLQYPVIERKTYQWNVNSL